MVPGGVVGRDIERLETVVIVFHLRPVIDLKAEAQKGAHDLLRTMVSGCSEPACGRFAGSVISTLSSRAAAASRLRKDAPRSRQSIARARPWIH